MLREETAADHEALDALSSGLFDDEAAYLAFLTGSANALFPIEEALSAARVQDILPDWPLRARSAALRQDLETFGATAADPESVPPFTRASLPGALYVLEGSRLGAKMLAPQALSHESARVRAATRYLVHGEGDNFWRSFLAWLETESAGHENAEPLVAGARAAFATFASAMTGARRLARIDNG